MKQNGDLYLYANVIVLLASNSEAGTAGCYIQDRLCRLAEWFTVWKMKVYETKPIALHTSLHLIAAQ